MTETERPCTCTLVCPPTRSSQDGTHEIPGMPFRQLDLHCPEHGIYPDGHYCPRCDHDDHRCPGCGDYLTHWLTVCGPCRGEYADPLDPHPEVP